MEWINLDDENNHHATRPRVNVVASVNHLSGLTQVDHSGFPAFSSWHLQETLLTAVDAGEQGEAWCHFQAR